MTLEDLQQIASPEASRFLEEHGEMRPEAFALRFQGHHLPIATMASQLELRGRAARKLPSWRSTGCLYIRRAFEQATGESVLSLRDLPPGGSALDLTGGLGVDCWHLSQHFQEVIYVDRDPLLCEMARINFFRLQRQNIEVHNQAAGFFLKKLPPERQFDLIFLDPDRRDAQGNRQSAFADCSPNLVALLPELQQRLRPGGSIWVKASPMLDIAAGLAELGALAPHVRARVISIDNEVKELLFQIGFEAAGDQGSADEPWVSIHLLRKGGRFDFSGIMGQKLDQSVPKGRSSAKHNLPSSGPPNTPDFRYIYEPDVAFYKSRLSVAFHQAHPEFPALLEHPEGYWYSSELWEAFPGRIFEIVATWPYRAKQVKKALKKRGIHQIELGRRYFDLPLKTVQQQLGIKTGGKDVLLLSRNATGRNAFLCRRIK